MKKFLIALSFLTTVFIQSSVADIPGFVHEYTVDLYYANGVLGDARNSEYRSWQIRSIKLRLLLFLRSAWECINKGEAILIA